MGNIDKYYSSGENNEFDTDAEDIYGFYEQLKEILIVAANYSSTFEAENQDGIGSATPSGQSLKNLENILPFYYNIASYMNNALSPRELRRHLTPDLKVALMRILRYVIFENNFIIIKSKTKF